MNKCLPPVTLCAVALAGSASLDSDTLDIFPKAPHLCRKSQIPVLTLTH